MPDHLKIGNHTDVGNVRKTNEDYYGTFDTPSGTLIVVCDGMGGYTGGSKASRLAVEHIRAHFTENPFPEDYHTLFEGAFAAAHNAITAAADADEELKQMGSTAVVMLIREGKAFFAHAGDSPLYMIRNNEISQLTRDHSYVQQLLDNNLITEEEAKEHPRKNVITKALGNRSDAVPEVCAEPLPILPGDRFVLCTDGLSNYFLMEDLKQEVMKADPQQVCMNLVNLAKERGGKDNITVQVVEVLSDAEVVPPVAEETIIEKPAAGTLSGAETTIIEIPTTSSQKPPVQKPSDQAGFVQRSPDQKPGGKKFTPFFIAIAGVVIVALFLLSQDYLFKPAGGESADGEKPAKTENEDSIINADKNTESQNADGPAPERNSETNELNKVQKPDPVKTKKPVPEKDTDTKKPVPEKDTDTKKPVPEKDTDTKKADGTETPKTDDATVEKKVDPSPPKGEDVPIQKNN